MLAAGSIQDYYDEHFTLNDIAVASFEREMYEGK